MKKIIIGIIALMVASALKAQFSLPSTPFSEQLTNQNLDEIPVIRLTDFDNEQLRKEASQCRDTTKSCPPKFGEGIKLDIDFFKEGGITHTNEGKTIVRLRLQSNTAEGLLFYFKEYNFNEDERLYIYDAKTRQGIGAFSYINNKESNTLATGRLMSKDVIIEYNTKTHSFNSPKLKLFSVTHIFERRTSFGAALPCHNGVNCNPWVTEWCDEIRATVQLIIQNTDGDGWLCSGVILNNTEGDFEPYIFTAEHCIDVDEGEFDPAATTVIYNFQSPQCDPQINGNDELVTDGVEELHGVMGWDVCPDNALLRVVNTGLPYPIPLNYNVFYAGWSTLGHDRGHEITVIHHPAGDVKKVSEGEVRYSTANCWAVNFDNGVTEGGSSGAPLFNENHFVIGTNSHRFRAQEDCEGDGNAFYGRISANSFWNTAVDFLAPNANNTVAVWGSDPIEACLGDIELFGDFFPANDWQAHNPITIQAANTIVAAPNGLDTRIVGSDPFHFNLNNTSDYTFRAGQSISLRAGFSVEAGNVFRAEIGSCEPFEGCGFNYQEARRIPNNNGVIEATSYNELSTDFSDVKIYPNPNDGNFTVELTDFSIENENIQLNVLNTVGQVVFSELLQNDKTVLDISNLSSGIYYIQIHLNGEVITKKLVLSQ